MSHPSHTVLSPAELGCGAFPSGKGLSGRDSVLFFLFFFLETATSNKWLMKNRSALRLVRGQMYGRGYRAARAGCRAHPAQTTFKHKYQNVS